MSQESLIEEAQESPSIRRLISEVAKDAKHLLATQGELAKIDADQTKKEASAVGGLFAVAAGAGLMGGIFLLVTIAWILVELGLPTWAGFGIVTLVLLITAGVAGLLGKKKSDTFKPLEISKRELDRTKQALSGAPAQTAVAVRPSSQPQQRG